MILIDANLLIYAGVSPGTTTATTAAPTPVELPQRQHAAASAWLQQQIDVGHPIGLPWQSLLAFLRISTNPRLFERPASIDAAWRIVDAWLQIPTVWIPTPTERHGQILGTLLRQANAQGNIITDAHLAALAIEHGLELCSTDGDFARFEGLRWRNPLREIR